MKSKMKIDNLYKVAVFFDPRIKQLKILEQVDVSIVKSHIKSQYASIVNSDESDDSTTTVQESQLKNTKNQKKLT
ncbi:hypothetical protein RCL_jg12870.t1 [Rhizophagus clarus]|uniref:Uncharacterized protein n=1 Tax=Rhizophagus clarus TaxID=94130 RepID=A0A8H3KTS4_9GLOM|nr:hypothetical protein RCL_jg12870.t1 [Rhizophagus clarus]